VGGLTRGGLVATAGGEDHQSQEESFHGKPLSGLGARAPRGSTSVLEHRTFIAPAPTTP
jgi:hypothetical protein